jgi:hypothetical protein
MWPQPQTPFSQDALPGHCATHVPPFESQQPDEHDSPPQQRSPAPPHAAHVLPLHARPEAVQVSCSQQGCPAPPQATQLPPSQVTPPAVQV